MFLELKSCFCNVRFSSIATPKSDMTGGSSREESSDAPKWKHLLSVHSSLSQSDQTRDSHDITSSHQQLQQQQPSSQERSLLRNLLKHTAQKHSLVSQPETLSTNSRELSPSNGKLRNCRVRKVVFCGVE